MEILVISGLSGAGKSCAASCLEDIGYYTVDNMPAAIIPKFAEFSAESDGRYDRVALVNDIRGGVDSFQELLEVIDRLREGGTVCRLLYLEADTQSIIKRYKETRRRHPLSQAEGPQGPEAREALIQIIDHERELLGEIREYAHVIDTSDIRGAQLQSYVKQLLQAPANQMTLVFQSFGFKHGIPVDADYVFDVRMLPNPYYDVQLRPLTGKDAPVQDFLQQQADVQTMQAHIAQFLDHWLPVLNANHRSYVTVAIGCTGGQHRSVYLGEQLAKRYQQQWSTLRRHREMDSRALANTVTIAH